MKLGLESMITRNDKKKMKSCINFEISKLVNLFNETNLTISETITTDFDRMQIETLIKSVKNIKNRLLKIKTKLTKTPEIERPRDINDIRVIATEPMTHLKEASYNVQGHKMITNVNQKEVKCAITSETKDKNNISIQQLDETIDSINDESDNKNDINNNTEMLINLLLWFTLFSKVIKAQSTSF